MLKQPDEEKGKAAGEMIEAAGNGFWDMDTASSLGLTLAVTLLIATVAIITLFIVAAKRGHKTTRQLAIMLAQQNALRLLTVGIIVLATALLAFAERLDTAAAAIMSGIAGYVLGGNTIKDDESNVCEKSDGNTSGNGEDEPTPREPPEDQA